MKELFKLLLMGIAWGCTMCVMILIIGGFIAGDDFMTKSTIEFTRQAMGSIITGIGFVVPSIVYKKTHLKKWMQTMIHMIIGFSIYFITAFRLGWIPVKYGLPAVLISISLTFLSATIIWFCYYLYYKKEAKIINDKINDMES